MEGLGPARILNLLEKFRTPENLLNASYQSLLDVTGFNRVLANRILSSFQNAQKLIPDLLIEYEQLGILNAKILTFDSSDYPEQLKNIYSPPLVLYVLGNLVEEDRNAISVVGTRMHSPYGKIQAELFAGELASQGITIVSGMARGIDSIAHRAALKTSGRTIAVIGSGLDVIYPAENNDLYREIRENGAIISEFELSTKPDAKNFPKRNRIISGLSLGTLIIETRLKGGAMQTAALSFDQNREVYALPGELGKQQSEGTNFLIKHSQAKLVTKPKDIIDDLQIIMTPTPGKNIPAKPQVELNLFEEKIITLLKENQKQIDEIADLTKMTTADCLVHLLTLEFKGVVSQLPGKIFYLN